MFSSLQALSDLSVHFGEVVGRGDLVTAAVGYYHIAKWGKTLRNYKVRHCPLMCASGHVLYVLQQSHIQYVIHVVVCTCIIILYVPVG